ncbi:MAG TPA: flagellar motor stator protein MotA [Bryobacteraceae bacterium]|nr:flagellar motor stator protein MotA [Bryobacteraceae bacterium]
MFPVVGIVIVFGCIAGGYLVEKGNLLVLMQPAELLIIAGAALGTIFIGNPPNVLKSIVSGVLQVFKGSRYNAAIYLDTLKFINDFFNTVRKTGLASVEQDLDEPDKSALFKRHSNFSKNKAAMHFFCDTMRTLLTGSIETHDLDHIMETDLDVLHHEGRTSANALTSVADSLPGLGIVAAVLGVVITMGSLGGPPEEIGHKVAAALVGTFLGILLCYGLLGPIAGHIKKHAEAEGEYFLCLRMALLANMKGLPPILAAEAARRAIPHHVRPTFQEMDKACRKPADGAAAGVAA